MQKESLDTLLHAISDMNERGETLKFLAEHSDADVVVIA